MSAIEGLKGSGLSALFLEDPLVVVTHEERLLDGAASGVDAGRSLVDAVAGALLLVPELGEGTGEINPVPDATAGLKTGLTIFPLLG